MMAYMYKHFNGTRCLHLQANSRRAFFDKDLDYCNPKDRGRFFWSFDNHLPTDIIPKKTIISSSSQLTGNFKVKLYAYHNINWFWAVRLESPWITKQPCRYLTETTRRSLKIIQLVIIVVTTQAFQLKQWKKILRLYLNFKILYNADFPIMLTFSHVENKFQSSYQCSTHTSFKVTLLLPSGNTESSKLWPHDRHYKDFNNIVSEIHYKNIKEIKTWFIRTCNNNNMQLL